MDTMRSVTAEDLTNSREGFLSERANVVAKNAVTSMGLRAAARSRGGRGQHDAV